MSVKEQQSRPNRTFLEEARVKPERLSRRAETLIAKKHPEQPMFNKQLMEDICEKSNLERAYK